MKFTLLWLFLISVIEKYHCEKILDEDEETIKDTIAKYGPLSANYYNMTLELPGPEILVDDAVHKIGNEFTKTDKGYTLKIRAITEHFSYNARYEEISIKNTTRETIPLIKGLFGEHFPRKTGGFYIRTIGYMIDELGYRQFLINLSGVRTVEVSAWVISGSAPIARTVLDTLIGGNSVG